MPCEPRPDKARNLAYYAQLLREHPLVPAAGAAGGEKGAAA